MGTENKRRFPRDLPSLLQSEPSPKRCTTCTHEEVLQEQGGLANTRRLRELLPLRAFRELISRDDSCSLWFGSGGSPGRKISHLRFACNAALVPVCPPVHMFCSPPSQGKERGLSSPWAGRSLILHNISSLATAQRLCPFSSPSTISTWPPGFVLQILQSNNGRGLWARMRLPWTSWQPEVPRHGPCSSWCTDVSNSPAHHAQQDSEGV